MLQAGCCVPDDLVDTHHPTATATVAWLPIRKRIVNTLLGMSSPSPPPSTSSAAAAVSDKLLTAATLVDYCLSDNSSSPLATPLTTSPMPPPPTALVAIAADMSSMESDTEMGSECSELCSDESSHSDLTEPSGSATERAESLADCNSNNSSTESLSSSSAGRKDRPPPNDDEVKVLKIVLRRRPLDHKQLQLITGGVGRALWFTTANGRTVARTYPRYLRQPSLLRHAGQSVRAGVIHHSSNPERHLTYYYLPRSVRSDISSSSSLTASGLH